MINRFPIEIAMQYLVEFGLSDESLQGSVKRTKQSRFESTLSG